MSWIAVAGVTITAVGAGVAAKGAADNAKAIGAANASNAQNEDLLYERQNDNLNKLIKQKNRKLNDLGGIFDRMESTGAFGDTSTLKNLRKAQNDFSMLAAGNFSAFEDQLKQNMSDALINTVGSGSPVGTFSELAANTQLQMRGAGIQQAVGISEYLSNEASKLLGAEFGIMDQKFNTNYQLDRARVSNVANYRLGKAATEGVGLTAYGNAGMQIGSAITSYGMNSATMGMQKDYLKVAQQQAQAQVGVANRQPAQSTYTIPSYAPVEIPSIDNGYNTPTSTPSWTAPEEPALPSPALYNNVPTKTYTGYGVYDWRNSAPYMERNGQPYTDDVGVLPPLSYNSNSSLLASVGASIVRA